MYLSPFSSVNRKHWCVFAGACLRIDHVIRALSRWVHGDRAVRNSAHLVKWWDLHLQEPVQKYASDSRETEQKP